MALTYIIRATARSGSRSGSALNLGNTKVRLIVVASTIVAFLYRSLTQRAPLLFLSTPPALPSTHGCTIHHPTILKNCEDISQLPGTPYTFLSCDPARREWSHAFGSYPSKAAVGEVYLWNHLTPESEPILISGHTSLGGDFHPLGLSSVNVTDRVARVFVTNQAKARATIEVLDVLLATGESKHVKTISNGSIHSPNGIAAYNATSFYVSNDMFMARRWSTALLLEALFAIPGGTVVFVSVPTEAFAALDAVVEKKREGASEMSVSTIARISLANGLAYNPHDSRLYVVSSTHGVYTYSLPDPTLPSSVHPHSFHRTPFGADNLFYSHSQRTLYISGVSSLSATATAMMSPEAPRGPSWTVELLPELQRMGQVEESVLKREKAFRAVDLANRPLREQERRWRSVFMDDGGFYGGISNGGVVDETGKFVAVSVVGEGVLTCPSVLERRGALVKEEVAEKDEL